MKRIAVACFLFLFFASGIFAAAFASLVGNYVANQHKVKSLIAKGTITIKTTSASGKTISEITGTLTMYMKYPNLFKLVLAEPSPSIVVQKGDLITQKIGPKGIAVTNKVNESSDLFRKYFAYDVDKNVDPRNVTGQSTVNENGKTLYRFTTKIDQSAGGGSASKTIGGLGADSARIFFDESGMIVRQILLAGDKEVVRTETRYVNKEGIFIAVRITTKMDASGMNIENTIAYDALSVNTVISDKEFELK
jgi:outer membrane lipoprotein-sorting protein